MNNYKNITHLLFDFDGTIADSLPLEIEIYNEIADKYNAEPLAANKVEKYRHLSIMEFLKERQIPLAKLPFLLKEGRQLMRQRLPELQPIQGIKDVLETAQSKGLQLGVVTSNEADIVEEFVSQHQCPHFQFIHSETNLFGKQRKLAKVIKEHQIEKDRVVYIGDESRDVKAAKRNEIDVWAVTWGLNSKEALTKLNPHKIFTQPQQLQNYLDSLTINTGNKT